ncbi:MAG: c-type cytochrome [Chitinophagales bacterium]|jgi:cytochrome c oxidase cbb3-type subunit 3|nr:c-type cytochrome [Chitinophagales bacterium]
MKISLEIIMLILLAFVFVALLIWTFETWIDYLKFKLLYKKEKSINLHQAYENYETSPGIKEWITNFKKYWRRTNNLHLSDEEADKIDTGHNYDGIRELDNGIPGWFQFFFFSTIIFALIYWWRFETFSLAPNQYEEYEQEVVEGELKKRAYLKDNAVKIDEATIAFASLNLDNGKKVYNTNCASCHVADMGGQTGPNLVDDNWLHGGAALDIYKSIKYGIKEKGMPSWKEQLNDQQILDVVNYIHSMKGKSPANPKSPQGAIYIDKPLETMSAQSSDKDSINSLAQTK